MDKPFVIFLLLVCFRSIFDVVTYDVKQSETSESERTEKTDGQQNIQNQDTEEISREDPSMAQDDDKVEIRHPSGAIPVDGAFKPPLNMPPIKFVFCVSCGYRQAFDQFAQILREKYPGIQISGENFPPSTAKSILAQVLGLSKFALIAMIIMGYNPFPTLNIATPSVYLWMVNNKLSSSLMVFMLSNSIEAMLISTGAFEIYYEDEIIWSKLESGRIPSPQELFQAIENNIAIRGGSKVFMDSNDGFGFSTG